MIWRSKPRNRDPKWNRQYERHTSKRPCSKKLSKNHIACGQRKSHQEFNRSTAAFICPKAHAKCGHKEKSKPRLPLKERTQICLTAHIESAHLKSQECRHCDEHHQKDRGKRGCEICSEFTAKNARCACECRWCWWRTFAHLFALRDC